jgi:hypothetical protein
MLELVKKLDEYKSLVMVAVLSGIAGAMIQRYLLSRHVSTGEAPHVPDIIAKPAVAVGHAVEKAVEIAVDTVTGRHHEHKHTDDNSPSVSETTPQSEKGTEPKADMPPPN